MQPISHRKYKKVIPNTLLKGCTIYASRQTLQKILIYKSKQILKYNKNTQSSSYKSHFASYSSWLEGKKILCYIHKAEEAAIKISTIAIWIHPATTTT